MKRPNPELATKAVDVEIDAFLTRMKGLSSAGIVQAMADINKDSTWFATEMSRMYDETDELFYKTKLMAMMVDLVKQKEGQRVVVENDMSSASDDQLKALRATVSHEIHNLLEGKNGEAAIIDIPEGGREPIAIPSAEDRAAPRSRVGSSEESVRDAETLQADEDTGEVPLQPSKDTSPPRRQPKRKNVRRRS